MNPTAYLSTHQYIYQDVLHQDDIFINPTVAFIKRLTDIVGSCIFLTLFMPLFLLIPIFIKLDSEGPVFFIQERVGLNGQTMNMIKFRTMRKDAEKYTGPKWADENDPRITRVGRILRKIRLDEIPQLFNVFKGEMSLIGPRPERPFFVDKLEVSLPYYDERIKGVKPGITGLAQVNLDYDTSDDSVKEKLLYDHAYGAALTRLNSYFDMEISIIMKTIVVMLTGKGAK